MHHGYLRKITKEHVRSMACSENFEGSNHLRFSWTQQANGIWVDAPAPTGFSKGAVESGWKDFIQNMSDVPKSMMAFSTVHMQD